MVCGRFPCLPCKYMLLLLMLFFHDVDTWCREIEQSSIVGETAELSVAGCLQRGNVIRATWNFRKDQVVDENGPSDNPQFKDRVAMNPHNFSLTITSLTHQDSGQYSFVSDTDKGQHPNIFITLHVYDSISKPDVTVVDTWHAEKKSCLVSLECSATPADNITYIWTVGNRTFKEGQKVNVSLLAEEGDATVNCTATNPVSQRSASKTVSCKPPTASEPTEQITAHVMGLIVGLPLVILLTILLLFLCRYRTSKDTFSLREPIRAQWESRGPIKVGIRMMCTTHCSMVTQVFMEKSINLMTMKMIQTCRATQHDTCG